MEKRKRGAYTLVALILLGCGVMAFTEVVVEPSYWIKSGVKILLFLVVPLVVLTALGERGSLGMLIPHRKGFLRSLLLGVGVYLLIMGAYWLTGSLFDYSAIVAALSADQGVGRGSFLPVAGYISFCNSLLEEFFFRGLAFLRLSERVGPKPAYLFSALAFAGYHIAMLAASFPLPLLLMALLGLAVGGLLFDFLDEKQGNLYNSWMVHMFADLALMTIWFLAL